GWCLGRWVAAPLVVRSRPLVRGGGSSDFARTLAHGTDATPATAATGVRRPPHKQKHRRGVWRLVAAVAAFCVPTTPAAPPQFLGPASLAGPAKQPPLPQRRSQQPRLLFPSGEVWGCRCRSWPLSVPARGAPALHAPETRPCAHGARCRLATAVRRTPRGPTAAEAAGNGGNGCRAPTQGPGTGLRNSGGQTPAEAAARQWQRLFQPLERPAQPAPRATNGPRSLEHSGPPATAATRRPPLQRSTSPRRGNGGA